MKKTIRYRITFDGTERYQDTMPDDAWCDERAYIAQARGCDFTVHECETIVDMDAPTGDKVRMRDRIIVEYRHGD